MTVSTLEPTLEPRDRIAELTRRWLPMLLNRAGVDVELIDTLRCELPDHDDELARRLELARSAVRTIASSDAEEAAQWANSSDEVISLLLRAHDRAARDPVAAGRIIARANRRLFGLLVGHPRQAQRPGPWWSRLLFSRAALRAAMF